MLFTELNFIIFFALFFTVYWLLKSKYARMALLLIGSGIFYGAWDYRFLALIMGVILISFLAQDRLAKLTEPRSRRFVLWSSVILLLSILGVFKYFNFFVGSFIAFGQTVGLDLKASTLSIILPVGISFYVFQAIGLIVDVSRRTISKRYNLSLIHI